MARYDHRPIWKTAMDLAVLLERAVRGFPRYHKYALGTDLRRQAQRIYSWAPPGAFPSFHPVMR